MDLVKMVIQPGDEFKHGLVDGVDSVFWIHLGGDRTHACHPRPQPSRSRHTSDPRQRSAGIQVSGRGRWMRMITKVAHTCYFGTSTSIRSTSPTDHDGIVEAVAELEVDMIISTFGHLPRCRLHHRRHHLRFPAGPLGAGPLAGQFRLLLAPHRPCWPLRDQRTCLDLRRQ